MLKKGGCEIEPHLGHDVVVRFVESQRSGRQPESRDQIMQNKEKQNRDLIFILSQYPYTAA